MRDEIVEILGFKILFPNYYYYSLYIYIYIIIRAHSSQCLGLLKANPYPLTSGLITF